MPAPSNDDFANAQAISGASGSTACSNVSGTTEASEPHVPGDVEATIWFEWTAPASGNFTFILEGTDYRFLGIYTGASLAGLSEEASDFSPGVAGDDLNLEFTATSGTTYKIQAGNQPGFSQQAMTLLWSGPPPNDDLDDAIPLAGAFGSTAGSTINASLDSPYDPMGPDTINADSTVWYSLACPEDWDDALSVLTIRVTGVSRPATYRLQALLFEATTYPPTGLSDFTEFGDIDVNLPTVATLTYSGPAPAGGVFHLGFGATPLGGPTHQTDFSFSWLFSVIHPARRTFEGRTWKWIASDLKTSRLLTVISPFATEISTSRLLNAAWPAACTVPADDPRVRTVYAQFDDDTWDEPFVARNIRALVGFRDTGSQPLYEVAYTGIMFQVFDAAEDNVPVSKISAWDARKYLEFVPLVDADGNLPGKKGLAYTATKANVIARAALQNWIDNNPGCLASIIFDLVSGTDEDCAEVDITFQQGTTAAEVWSQLEQQGVIDIGLDPVWDPAIRPGVLSVVNFEVEHGAQRNSAIFSWDRSPRSLPQIGRLEDGLKLANTVQYFTGENVAAPVHTDADSISKYGEYWTQRAWPGQNIAAAVEAFAIEELLFRKNGQTVLSATPAAARAAQPIQDYDYGDRAPFYASPGLRKAIAGVARIYGIPFTVGDDGSESVGDLIVSADAVVAE